MKWLFIIFLFSTWTHANQVELMKEKRKEDLGKLHKSLLSYCEKHYFPKKDGSDYLYYCRLQMQLDCKEFKSSKRQKEACSQVKGISELEKQISATNEIISKYERYPLLRKENSKETKTEGPIKEAFAKIPSLMYGTVNVNEVPKKYLSEMTQEEIEGVKKELETLEKIKKNLSGKKIQIQCSEATECEVIPYGNRTCGGAVDSFVISTRDPNLSLIKKEIDQFNQADKRGQKVQKGFLGLCVVHGFSPPRCVKNKCEYDPQSGGIK